MNRLERYIAKTVLAAIALVTLMLAGLQIFILFVNQLDVLGKGNFNLPQVALFVFLQTPYQVYLFFPMASLIGSLIGLGIMANNRELIVMRAAGMSIWQITLAVLKVAILIIILITFVGELLIPKLDHFANDIKSQALSDGQTLRTAKGAWMRHKNDFIFIGVILNRYSLINVNQFHFDKQNRLRFARRIFKADYVDGQWRAWGIFETTINALGTQSSYTVEKNWEIPLQPKVLSVSSNEPDEMTLTELRRFLDANRLSHQNILNYELAFWQRLIQPLTTIVMMMLAIPFIFGPLRSSTMGSKLIAGITVGFSFYIFNKFIGPLSQVFQWPVKLAAIGPTCVFALLGLYLIRRMR